MSRLDDGAMSGLEYHQIHRLGRPGWWRALVGVVMLTILFFAVGPLLVQAVLVAGYAVTGADVSATATRLVDTDHVSPSSLAYLNVALAMGIPAAMLVNRLCHGLTPQWLGSVLARIRWRWLAVCLALAFVSLLATLVVSALLPHQAGDADTGGGLNDWTSTTRDFALVILLLTPLQAAGEEFVFRGYLTQAFGGLFGRRRLSVTVAVVVPAALFALAHGGQDPPVFVDRFAFGLVAGVLVIATGGLEAGIAMHVLNNFLAFGLALAFSSMTSALNPTGGTWWSLPGTLTQSLVYLGLVVLVARRIGIRTGVSPEAAAAMGYAEPASGDLFARVRPGRGYDVTQVNAFLATARAADSRGAPIAELLATARFRTANYETGYDMRAVDRHLQTMADPRWSRT